jgi:hypothetical protein
MAKNAQRFKMVKVLSSNLPKREKRAEPERLTKTAFCQKLLPGKVAKLAIPTHPKAQKHRPRGEMSQNFTHERGTLTVLERWAFLADLLI